MTTPQRVGSDALGDSLTLENPKTSDLRPARDWARRVLGKRFDKVELVLTELLTNAIVHGEPGTVVVRLTPRPGTVVVSVSNPAPDSLPTASDTGDTITPDGVASHRGRGLLIASAVAHNLTSARVNDTLEVSATVPA